MSDRIVVAEKDPVQQKLDILEFALKHGLMIHPDRDLEGFCRRTVNGGQCICRDVELYCPCDQALPMCRENGFCTCRLLITPERYPEVPRKARERWQQKRR